MGCANRGRLLGRDEGANAEKAVAVPKAVLSGSRWPPSERNRGPASRALGLLDRIQGISQELMRMRHAFLRLREGKRCLP
jgi:hypothetical protein